MAEFLGDAVRILLFLCIGFVGLMIVAATLVASRLRNVWRSSTKDMQEIYDNYRRKHPQASEREALQHLIKEQARLCGMIGVFTSFGGFITMAIALPIDLYLTGRIQSKLARFIAQQHGKKLNLNDPALAEIRDNVSMDVDAQFTRGRRRLKKESAEFITRKFVSKFVPFLGAILGYRFNYKEAKATGTTALQYYTSNTVQLPAGS